MSAPPGGQFSRPDETRDLRSHAALSIIDQIPYDIGIHHAVEWPARFGWTEAGWHIWCELEQGEL